MAISDQTRQGIVEATEGVLEREYSASDIECLLDALEYNGALKDLGWIRDPQQTEE